MIFYDEQSNLNAVLGERLQDTFQRIVKSAAKTMSVFQCVLVCLHKESVEVVAKASSAHAPSFTVIPSFAGHFSYESSAAENSAIDSSAVDDSAIIERYFPQSSIAASSVFKQWAKTYFGANTFLRGKAHRLDDKCVFLVAINVNPERKDEGDKLVLLDEWLDTELSKFQLEKAENKQNTLYEKLQSVADIGTWEVEFATNTLTWSSQTRKIHEVDSTFKPTLDSAINFYKEGFDRDEIARIVANTIETGEPWSSTLQLVSAKGNIVWIETHGMAEMQNGKCLRLFGTCQNVNKAVKLRIALDEKRQEAEGIAAEKGALLSRVSHELKTPLNGITGMLEAIKGENEEARRIKKAEFALRSAKRLSALINDVVDYTSIIKRDFTLDMAPFNLKLLFEDIVSVLKMRCEDQNSRLTAHYAFDATTVIEGDAARLAQIMKNVVSHLTKYAQDKEIVLHVALKHRENDAMLMASVSGKEVVLDEDAVAQLFEPLAGTRTQASEELNDNGLALTAAKQLVSKMKGELTVSSNDDQGTCFDIVIPVESVKQCDGLSEEVSFTPELLEEKINILVVDDNDINRMVLESMFDELPFTVDSAENGQIAVDKARSTSYDLIFMDCAMPVLDGIGATKVILAEKLLSEIGRIVAVTANTSIEDKKACLGAGMSGFLPKPVVKNDVLSHVKQTLVSKLTFT